VECPRCKSPNEASRRFCSQCGQLIAVCCPRCGFGNKRTDRYCGGCGDSLSSSALAALAVNAEAKAAPGKNGTKLTVAASAPVKRARMPPPPPPDAVARKMDIPFETPVIEAELDGLLVMSPPPVATHSVKKPPSMARLASDEIDKLFGG
jgi:hypothetical protein